MERIINLTKEPCTCSRHPFDYETDAERHRNCCENLLFNLEPDEELPDHICGKTAEDSCRDWLKEAQRFTALPVVHLPDGRAVLCNPFMNSHGISHPAWPLPIMTSGHVVYAVISQWVIDPPPDNFEKILLKHPGWNELQQLLQKHVSDVLIELQRSPEVPPLKRIFEGALKDDLAIWALFYMMLIKKEGCGRTSDLLQTFALPSTPATCRYALDCAIRSCGYDVNSDIKPTRGTLITSYLLSPSDPSSQSAPLGAVVSQAVFQSSWGSTEKAKIAQTIKKHREWWLTQPQSQMHKVNPRSENSGSSTRLTRILNAHGSDPTKISRTELINSEFKQKKQDCEEELQRPLTANEEQQLKKRVQNTIGRALKRKYQKDSRT